MHIHPRVTLPGMAPHKAGSSALPVTIRPGGSGLVVPVPPTGLIATPGDAQITLNWTASPTAEQVDLYQVFEGDVWLDNAVPVTQFVVTQDANSAPLENGQEYFFRVGAHNAAGYGPWSELVSSTPVGPGPPVGTSGKHISVHHQRNYLPSTIQYHLGDYVVVGEWATTQAASDLSIPVYGYSAAVTARDAFFTGLSATEALAGGHELRDSAGNVLANASYQPSVLCDPGRAAYQAAFVAKIINQLRDIDGADGVFIDDLTQSSHIATGVPAIYPTQASWRAAVEEWVSVVVPQLRNAGLLVMLNTGAWWPGHAGGSNPQPGALDYDNGDASIDWATTLGSIGGTSFVKCMIENGFQTVHTTPGTIRTMGSNWDQHWDGWANVITQLEAAGIDYVGMADATSGGDAADAIYLKASMMLWMNRPGSTCMFRVDDTEASPFGTVVGADLGAPLGAATLNGQTWTRIFEDGIVQVNPFNQTASITLT